MERYCSNCRAVLAEGLAGKPEMDWCPACGGALLERASIEATPARATAEVDHRGVVLPRRHAVGGVISPW